MTMPWDHNIAGVKIPKTGNFGILLVFFLFFPIIRFALWPLASLALVLSQLEGHMTALYFIEIAFLRGLEIGKKFSVLALVYWKVLCSSWSILIILLSEYFKNDFSECVL